MRSFLPLFAALLLFAPLAGLSGCDPTEVTVDGGPAADATTGPAGRIRIESSTPLTLTYGERSELRVRYLEGELPRAGVELGLALSGTANDTDLSEDYIVSGMDGRAVAELVAGSVGSAFRVRVSAARAAAAYIDVSVSDAGFGGLQVGAAYTGARAEATRRMLTVYSDVGCEPSGGYPSSAVARQ
ncbi:MAG TPA: hypothetical protein ENK57_18655, partial [Polyangiaceae bacterium]|nr:hypothetical protein [Polyangiaceae bacterium]